MARVERLIVDVPMPHYELAESRHLRSADQRESRSSAGEIERSWAQMIDSMEAWTMMVTLTFRRQSAKGFRVTELSIEKALRLLVRLVNHDFFGKRLTNKGWTIACAAVTDFGAYGDHPHVHMLIKGPIGVPDDVLGRVLERAARRVRIVDRQRYYSQYYNAGGAEYLIGHGTDRMVVSLMTRAYQGA